MAESRKLIAHYMCPFAQRALYAASFKGVECEVVEVDLANKPDWFFEASPLGKVPALSETKEGKTYNLFESLQVCEYLDSFSGPNLYPRNQDGSVNVLEKTIVDAHINSKVSGFISSLVFFFFNEPNSENTEKLRNNITDLNKENLAGGNYFMHKVLGRNELTMADIALLPFVERLMAYKEGPWAIIVEGLEMDGVNAWYEKLTSEPWVQKYFAGYPRLNKLYEILRSGNYKGLTLPLSVYDS